MHSQFSIKTLAPTTAIEDASQSKLCTSTLFLTLDLVCFFEDEKTSGYRKLFIILWASVTISVSYTHLTLPTNSLV